MKNKSNLIVGFCLIIALAVGGYFARDYFLAMEDADMVSDEKVETKVIAECETGPLEYTDETPFLEVISNADASCFLIDPTDDKDIFTVSQMDRETFTETVEANGKPVQDMIDERAKCLKAFLNTTYRTVTNSEWDEYVLLGNVNDASGSGLGLIYTTSQIDSFFGGSIDDYFADNKLVLNCEGVEITKVGYCASDADGNPMWLFVGEADVTTEQADPDGDLLGLYAKEGETKHITVCTSVVEAFSERPNGDTYTKVLYFK